MTRNVMKANVTTPQLVDTPSTCKRTLGGKDHDADVVVVAGREAEDVEEEDDDDDEEEEEEEEEEDDDDDDDDEEEEDDGEEDEEEEEEDTNDDDDDGSREDDELQDRAVVFVCFMELKWPRALTRRVDMRFASSFTNWPRTMWMTISWSVPRP
jgi:hypothetical protein